jgi:hypothetical protein
MLEGYTWSRFQLFKSCVLYHIFRGAVNLNVQGVSHVRQKYIQQKH